MQAAAPRPHTQPSTGGRSTMMSAFEFSKREEAVAKLLLEGKSNKQIALALDITDSTVEFHLTNLYAKLGVGSRTEAIIRLSGLGKSLEFTAGDHSERDKGYRAGDSGESLVENIGKRANNKGEPTFSTQEAPQMTSRTSRPLRKYRTPVIVGIILVLIAVAAFFLLAPKSWSKYERECEYPDSTTVGQTIGRSNASRSNVLGQFGTTNASPWPAQPGYVIYKNISTPKVDSLYLKVRYSKNSPSSVAILVYIDDEKNPRASFSPLNQSDWNRFTWTDPIYLGSIESGLHTVKFSTDGQQYGVADLDKFVLTKGVP